MLLRWAASGKVTIVKTPGGKRLYSNTDVHRAFGNDQQPMQKSKVCYARVSSEHQRGQQIRKRRGFASLFGTSIL